MAKRKWRKPNEILNRNLHGPPSIHGPEEPLAAPTSLSPGEARPGDPQSNNSQIEDRMLHYRRSQGCPECKALPVVCMQKKGDYAAYRCRSCGLRWEVGA